MNKENTKVLFLDIDGVLCTFRAHFAYGRGLLLKVWDPTSCQLIHRLCEKFDLKIVVSSNWKNDPELPEYLHKYDLSSFLHPDSKIPTVLTATLRGQEVKAWLDKHPEVIEYIIVDDDSDFLEDQMSRLILTENAEGFGAKDYQKMEGLLGHG